MIELTVRVLLTTEQAALLDRRAAVANERDINDGRTHEPVNREAVAGSMLRAAINEQLRRMADGGN